MKCYSGWDLLWNKVGRTEKQQKIEDWPQVDNCWSWALGTLVFIMLFSLLLCMLQIFHKKVFV